MSDRRVTVCNRNPDLGSAVETALEQAGILARIGPDTRVALKPNLTYPYHKIGVTTSPEVVRETVRVIRQYTRHIAIVESDGGYGVWSATEAFAGHGYAAIRDKFDVELINLCDEPREMLSFMSRGSIHKIPLPTRLLHDTDVLITMPVPKIHSMTGLTLAYKNQWGCVPDNMRMRSHYLFNDAIIAINRALRPMVLADGTYFLDQSGPMEGAPVQMDLVIGASDVGAFDRYVSELMGWSWRRIPHLKRAVKLGDMPANLADIHFDVHPGTARTHTFKLRRSSRNWIALAGFNSRFLTWLGYESWFGRVVLHGLLYAMAGKPVSPRVPDAAAAEKRAA